MFVRNCRAYKCRNFICIAPYIPVAITRMIGSRRMKWARYVARMREKRNAGRTLVRKPAGKRPLRRPRSR
jgi:hypothetical protein